MIRVIALISTALLVPMPMQNDWTAVKTGRPHTVSARVTVVLPPGWVYSDSKNGVLATHDGALLELVSISVMPHAEAFAAAHRRSSPEEPPEDLAESYLANLQAGETALAGVQVLETTPAEIAGQPGFRVYLRYRTAADLGGVAMEQIAVGAALPSGLLLATFDAPALHYFDTYRVLFETMLETLQRPR